MDSRTPSLASARSPATISGECDPAFAAVREAFEHNFAAHGELGAAVCVMVGGKPVVDLWGGYADAARTRQWGPDTLVQVMSTTKAIVTIAAHQLVERGLLDLDAPVARYWPEFAQAGKAEIPVRYLLSHQVGLPALDRILPAGATTDWDLMTRELAAAQPVWPPGERCGYHPVSFGWLVGELIRRASGKRVGEYIRENIAEPVGERERFGHPGYGGSLALADPDADLAFCYVMNQFSDRQVPPFLRDPHPEALPGDPRGNDLLTAAFDAL